jgi:lipopolysaccharide export system permease protein
MSQFDGEDGLLNFNRNKEDMLNSVQLLKSIDTFRVNVQANQLKYSDRVYALFSGGRQMAAEKASPAYSADTAATTETTPESPGLQATPAIKEPEAPNTDSTRLRQQKDSLVKSYGAGPFPKKTIATLTNNAAPPEALPPAIQPPKVLIKQKSAENTGTVQYFAQTIDSAFYRNVITRAQNDLGRDRDELLAFTGNNIDLKKQLEKYTLRLHQQYSWALVCVLFLFIGAPLGSIIRKGGYGYSLLVAILFYMMFIISTIFGEKLVKNETMTGVEAAWLPCLILMPFGLVVTILALRDIKINPTVFTTWVVELYLKVVKKPQVPM